MTKLSDTITIKVDGEDREIFMSFGLLNELTKIIGDPARVASVTVDPEMRDDVLNAVLSKRKTSGKIISQADIDDIDIPVEDVEILLDWASEHALSFFIRSLKKVIVMTKKHEDEMKALASSASGFSDSLSGTQSSGS